MRHGVFLSPIGHFPTLIQWTQQVFVILTTEQPGTRCSRRCDRVVHNGAMLSLTVPKTVAKAADEYDAWITSCPGWREISFRFPAGSFPLFNGMLFSTDSKDQRVRSLSGLPGDRLAEVIVSVLSGKRIGKVGQSTRLPRAHRPKIIRQERNQLVPVSLNRHQG